MLQNLPLESLQFGSGIKAELLGEQPAGVFIGPQSLGLPAGEVEGPDLQGPEPFA